jgi:hypothetical protein
VTTPEELPTVHIVLGPHDSTQACPVDAGCDGHTVIPLGLSTASGPPEVKCLRVSWLEGYDTPLVEMWAERDRDSCDGPASYAYWRVSQPWVTDHGEWLRLLGTAKVTTFEPVKPAEPKMRGPERADLGFLADGERPPPARGPDIVARAKRQHDRECSCDPRYLMSCPRMAQAILDAGVS